MELFCLKEYEFNKTVGQQREMHPKQWECICNDKDDCNGTCNLATSKFLFYIILIGIVLF